ncbi:MAG: cation:proton antiporter [Candidatus Thorarchaeota archaeon]|nr:MAG: cation:proton antiporter [Candidatus Thorarchaeota archaeon]
MAAEQYLIAGILIIGAGLARIAERHRFPYPIPLIVAGMVLGQTLPPEGVLETIPLDFIAQLTLATVLFYAGLTMNLKELRLSLPVVGALASVGVLATSLIAGLTIGLLLPVLWTTALLIGAILSPTDPAALFSVLESGGVRVKRKVYSILEGEAVFNDATSVILVITVFTPLIVEALAVPLEIAAAEFALSLGMGVLIGFAVAYTIGSVILRSEDSTNTTILTATTPILAYGLGEAFGGFGLHPGAIAAVFTGIFMANARRIGLEVLPQRSMRDTTKNVSFAFEIVVFIMLGYTVNIPFVLGTLPGSMIGVLPLGLVVAMLVVFVARPAAVFLVTAPDRDLSNQERFFVSWAGVKGVASAALAAISVSIITEYMGASDLTNTVTSIVFIVLMVSLVLQGLTAPYFARSLGLEEEVDVLEEITVHRDATRHALLKLVDDYTEGNVEASLYQRLKAELEEEIFSLEDELRRQVAEKRARLLELQTRERIYLNKLEYLRNEFEQGKLKEISYYDERLEIERELEELESLKRHQKHVH